MKTAQLIDFRRRTKTPKLGNWNRIWNTASGCQNESLSSRPISACRTGLACCCQIVLIKRLPNQGLDYGLAANV